ncbi:hypothetical protein AAA799B03_00130 [Marine Group I thaumarchaeote SCGC AAA799-B03]|uniref:Glycosyltransferase RgtA/B/C/D-like domain-containing protein n=1 Tax=Marine Group I thaumarchaeote SCGC AAA799-B03 TaxID=1502289 RepID=A0A087S926_9ARCH|nr:hypothetical protein AAA799B03_00130 [Marine Group I thaumarchaeote SCGC AAA799-B03]
MNNMIVKQTKEQSIGILLSLSSILSISFIVSHLFIPIFPTINRFTYSYIYTSNFLGTPLNDAIAIMILTSSIFFMEKKYWHIGGLSISSSFFLYYISEIDYLLILIPIVIIGAIIILNYKNARKYFSTSNFFMWSFIILSIFSLYSVIRWLVFPLDQIPFFEGLTWHLVKIEFDAFYLIARFSPILITLLITSFLIFPFRPYLVTIWNSLLSYGKSENNTKLILNFNFQKFSKYAFYIALGLGLLIPFYALITVPDGVGIGTDIIFYHQWLTEMHNFPDDTIHLAFVKLGGDQLSEGQGDRPLTLLFLYALSSIFNTNSTEFLNSIFFLLTPLLILSSYFFAKQVRDQNFARVVMILTPFSYQVIVGLYTGFIANWLAVITTFITFALILKLEKNFKLVTILLIFLSVLATMFFHTYTWTYLLATISLFLGIKIIFERRKISLKFVISIFLIMLSLGAVDYLKGEFLESNVGIQSNVIRATDVLSVYEFTDRWNNTMYNFTVFFGGYYNNTVLLLFAIVGMLFLTKKNSDYLLAASIFVAALPILFGEYGVQSRLYYDMPIHIIATLGLLSFYNSKLGSKIKIPVIIFIFIHFLLYGIRSVSNFQLVM